MSIQPIQFTLQLSNIPDAIHQEAELNAKEAYVMTQSFFVSVDR